VFYLLDREDEAVFGVCGSCRVAFSSAWLDEYAERVRYVLCLTVPTPSSQWLSYRYGIISGVGQLPLL
jgi:hypothetical protein